MNEIILYASPNGATKVEVHFEDETFWLTQRRIAELFGVDVRTVSEHLTNIFDSGELDREATIRKFRRVQIEGGREVERELDHYSLDAIIAVAEFRQWEKEKGATAAIRAIDSKSFARRMLVPGDMVVEISGGGPSQPVGRTLVVDQEALDELGGKAISSNFCRRVRFKSHINPFYVDQALKLKYSLGELDQFQTETTNIRNLTFPKFISETSIRLPQREVQDQLVMMIEGLQAQIGQARDRLATIPTLLKKFRQSVLAAACSGQLTADWRADNDEARGGSILIEDCQARAERKLGKKAVTVTLELDIELPDLPDSWMWAPLGNVTLKVGDVDHRMPKQHDGGIPYISTKDFTQRGISFERAKRISQADFDQLSKKIRPNRGDILISRYGTVGEVRLVETDQPHQVSYSVAIVNCHELDYLSRWLAFSLSSPTPQEFMRKHTRATSQPDLGLQHIRIIPVPIAPKNEQVEIMRRVESLFALADSIEARLADATAQVERTTQAILANAFRGEL